MRLTKNNLAFYLTDKGFLDKKDLINGDFMLTQTQSRNSIFLVSRGEKSGLFVKQLVTMDMENAYLMQKDATVHYLFHHSDLYKGIVSDIPHYFGYDPKNHVFITEYFPNAKNILEWSAIHQKLSKDQSKIIANILHSYHFDISNEIEKNTSLQFFNKTLPWIFNLPGMPQIQNDIVFNMILNDDYLTNQLEELRKKWNGNSLVHGDIKLVNFIVVTNELKESIKLIDWEIANLGDPLWDVAGLLQSYIFAWLTNTTPNSYETQLNKGYEFLNFSNRKEVINAFWQQYTKNQKWDSEEINIALIKTMKYIAARLLQSARELNQFTPNHLLPKSYLLVQMARSIFQSPEVSAKNLLGIIK